MKRSPGKICTGLIRLAVIFAVPFVFFPLVALAIDYTFTPLDVPGASFTEVFGINTLGNIVGVYGSGGIHGSLYAEGRPLPSIDFPDLVDNCGCLTEPGNDGRLT